MVRITLPNGVEQYVPLALDHKPTRQQQKLAALRTYVQQHPGGWRKHVQLADLLYTMGHWEEAISICHHVLHRQPFYLQARLRLGQMLRLLQRENEAIKVYADALASADRAATKHYLHGCMAICNRHLEKAVQSYMAAADLDPGNALYRRELGLTWLRAGHPEEALQAFDIVLADHPDDLVALTFSYAPLMAAGRDEDAQWRMEHAWQLDAENALALAQLIDSRCRRGQVWGDAGRRTKALLTCAIQLAHESPDVQAAQAHYHIARGEQRTGLALLQQYTATHPICPSGWYDYARWCLHSGAVLCAVAAILQAYALAPHDPAIHQMTCVILTVGGGLRPSRPASAKRC
jgi:tetratricopeptide (TPR) repeat protein